MNKPLHVLIVEDQETDAELLVIELRRGGYVPEYERVETAETMRAALDEKTWDIIISDYSMPHFNGIDALKLLKKTGIDIPFILVSGAIGEEVAVEAMKLGAHDYLMKDKLIRLVPAIERELHDAEERRERRKAEQQIQNFFDLAPYLLCIADLTTYHYLKINPAFEKNLGYSEEELLSKPFPEFIHLLDREKTNLLVEKTLGSKETHLHDFENRILRKDGSYIWISWRSNFLAEEGIAYFVGRDITDQKSREEELKKRLMKYRIEDGSIYLVKERTSKISSDAFLDILSVGYGGLTLTRTPTREFHTIIKGEYEALWLSEHEREDAIDPMISALKDRISKLAHRDVLLIDRLDYIISKNGFAKTAAFIQWLKEQCYIWNLVAILSIDPMTLDRKQMRILEKECEELEPLHKTTLSPELFDMLKAIYGRSLKKVSSTYETIMKDLSITRPTVRKRIGTLEFMGYVIEEKKGNMLNIVW